MGRHSSREQTPFLRSLAGWVLPWVLVAAVAVTAVGVAISAFSEPSLEAEPPRDRPPAASDDEPSPSPEPSETQTPEPEPQDDDGSRDRPRKRDDKAPRLITEGVTVQVLNGAGAARAGTRMSARLARLGFEIVAVGEAAQPYARTVAFWSSESARPAARALAMRFGWRAAPKPANLSPSVAVHVVVGRDEV